MKELPINTLWTNSTNTLIKCKVGDETIRLGESNGRLFAEIKRGGRYLPLELSGLPLDVHTPEQRKDICRQWKRSNIQLQKQLLSVSPKPSKDLRGPIPCELFQDVSVLREWFEQHPAITELNFTHGGLTPAEFGALMQVLPQTHITSLILDNNELGRVNVEFLSKYLPTTKLTSLSLRSCKINDKGMAILAPALMQSPVTTLNLYRNRIGDSGVQALAQNLPSSNITELNLHRCYIGSSQILCLLKALSKSKISVLDLGWNELEDKGAHLLAQVIIENPQFAAQLKVCRLQSTTIGSQGATKLAEAFLCSKIEEIDLSMNNIQNEGSIAFAAVLAHAPLHKLNLSWNEIGHPGTEALFRYLSKASLTHLDLSGNKLGEQGATALSHVLSHSLIEELNLGSCEIDDTGISMLSRALPHSPVKQLDLQDNNVTPTGIQQIASILRLSSLTHLYFQKNQMRDEGMQTIGMALPSSAIKFLDVRQNGVENEGAIALVKGSIRSSLTTLCLDDNQIGDEAIESIAQLLESPESQLSVLSLQKNLVTSHGVVEFLSSLPKSKLTTLNLEGNPIHPAQLDTLKLQLRTKNERRQKFFAAIKAGDLPQIEQLLKRNVSVNTRDDSGNTPLHLSVGNINLIRVLLNYQPVALRNDKHQTALELAQAGGMDSVKRLLQQMVDIPKEFTCPILGTLMSDPVTAADGKNYERAAIEQHFANSRRPRTLVSPFHGGKLEHGNLIPNYELKNQILAFATLHPELYEQLHLPNETQQEFVTALHTQNREQLERLLGRHKQLLFSSIEGKLPIQIACQTSIELLRAIIMAYPESLRPPLDLDLCAKAAEGLGQAGVKLLFELLPKSALFSLRDLWFEAISASTLPMVNVLLQMGAHRQAKNKKGMTALEKAQQKGNQAIINALMEAPGLPHPQPHK